MSKLFEFRIKYNAGKENCAMNNFHYYMAKDSSQAFSFHVSAIKQKHICAQNISIEKYNPYSEKWEDESGAIQEQESNYQL